MHTIVRALCALILAACSAMAALPAAASTPPASQAVQASSEIGPVAADVDDFTFESMDAQYTIGRDDDGASTLKVVETFVASFPETDQNHGLRRSIPDTYNGQPLDPHLISVTDGDGNARPAEVEHSGGTFSITSRADDYVHGTQTYVFTYTLRHVTWSFGDTDADEFYWDVNGVDWAQPFDRVTATLHVPADLADALTGDQACYQGREGSTGGCEITAEDEADGGVSLTASQSHLMRHATMTIAVGFEKGTFVPFDTSFFATAFGWLQLVAVLVALVALALAIRTRLRTLKDASGRPVIIAEYEPPRQIDALQSAVLLGRKTKAVPAEVLEQAVTGSIRILEGEKKLFGRAPLQAELLDRSKADGDGRMLLEGLFGKNAAPRATFEFGRSSARFSSQAQKMLAWAEANLEQIGLRRRVRPGTRALPITLGVLALAATILLGAMMLSAHIAIGLPVVLMVVSAGAFAADIVLLAHKPLSAAGAEVRDHLHGLELFMRWAEADRIRMLQSPGGAERTPIDGSDPRQVLRLYESLLPYAIVFGQEREWAQRLAVMYDQGYGLTTTPYWYVGVHGFNAAALAVGLSTLSTVSNASSSTSGGSTGGGFAGGGGGGGGGGGV